MLSNHNCFIYSYCNASGDSPGGTLEQTYYKWLLESLFRSTPYGRLTCPSCPLIQSSHRRYLICLSSKPLKRMVHTDPPKNKFNPSLLSSNVRKCQEIYGNATGGCAAYPSTGPRNPTGTLMTPISRILATILTITHWSICTVCRETADQMTSPNQIRMRGVENILSHHMQPFGHDFFHGRMCGYNEQVRAHSHFNKFLSESRNIPPLEFHGPLRPRVATIGISLSVHNIILNYYCHNRRHEHATKNTKAT